MLPLRRLGPALVLFVALSVGCDRDPAPPVAATRPFELTAHGDVRVDEYYWLKERENPEVIAYLEAENEYTRATMAHTEALQERLFEEIRGRIKEDDASVPYRKGGFWYYTRYETGGNYPLWCRKPGSLDSTETVLFNGNTMAEGTGYFSLSYTMSPSQARAAYAVDTVGRRKYHLRFRDLATGNDLDEGIPDVTGNVVWANDDATVFYAKQDPETLRSYQIWRHRVGTPAADDVLVFEEADETFSIGVTRSKSDRFLFIVSAQTLATEYRMLDADEADGAFQVVVPRSRGHEYDMDHLGDRFYFRTNFGGAKNFQLMAGPVGPSDPSRWTPVIPHREDVFLDGFELFDGYLVAAERSAGLMRLRVMPWGGAEEHYVEFDDPAYLVRFDTNPETDTNLLRFVYTSLTTPNSTFDYDMGTRERTLLKRDEVVGDFDVSRYRSERLMATARDGAQVPVSLVYRVDLFESGRNPLLLYGYGSYGASTDATFQSARLSLLDRGFVYAIAHIRGGQEMGRDWYENGKLLTKMNTFTDFIDVADFLVEKGYSAPDQVYAQGGSAGGLLMGAIVNLRPDRWRGVIAAVPFVDVVTTMLDDSIPLTTGEYDEWGNPNDSTYYAYMKSYSPYDNVEAKAYPNLLVTTGLHDSQVQYWEPAKWVARLRARKTDQNRLLLKTNMSAGHGGASARFERFRETAFQYAFLLDLAGRAE